MNVCLTVCATGAGAGVDSAWGQEKLEAREMLKNGAESPTYALNLTLRMAHLP